MIRVPSRRAVPPALLLLSALAAGAAHAQTPAPAPRPAPAAPAAPPARAVVTVTGIVYDSVAAAPLKDAFVQLVRRDDPAQARGTTTDSAGRFRLDSVAAGTYVAGFQHPRLDQLLLQSPLLGVELGATPTQELFLGIPSAATLAPAHCPASAGDGTGVLVGRVRDADSSIATPGATVVASWAENVFDRAGMRRQLRAVNTTADAEGRYTLCGVPGDMTVIARASASGGRTSGEVSVEIAPGSLLQRDLLVAVPGAARRGTARVAGQVRRPDGTPVPGAQVLVFGSSAADTTDARGMFALDALPAGTSTLEARAVGFTPRRQPVDLENDRAATATVTLDPLPPVLDTVAVRGRAGGSELARFEERMRRGAGRFMTSEEIERRNAVQASDLLRTMPGVQITPVGTRGARVTLRGCTPTVYIDRMAVQGAAADLNAVIQATEIAAIEVYNSSADTPADFQRPGSSCGTMIIWTKGRLR